jgi:hypothetical protein
VAAEAFRMTCVLCRAMLLQVPHLDGQKATQANAAMRGARGNALVAMAALADLASDNRGGGQPVYIPLVSRGRSR